MDDNQTVEYGEPARVIRPTVRFNFDTLLGSPATWILLGAVLMYLAQRKKL